MKKSITLEYDLFENFDELTKDLKELYKNAQNATKRAYAPYSNFHVGCAIELENGTIITGTNQENAAYPSGLCAERTALFHIGSTYSEPIKTIAIAAKSINEDFFKDSISPCGACRQVMSEFELKQNQSIAFLMPYKRKTFLLFKSINLLLPFTFDKSQL